jgi:hypothetical protein
MSATMAKRERRGIYAGVVACLVVGSVSVPAQAEGPSAAADSVPPPAPPAFPPCITGTTGCGGHWVFVPDSAAAAPATSPTPPAAPTTLPASAPDKATYRGPVYQHANTWDLNIEGAFGRYFGDSPVWTGFGRIRAGALFVREPLYEALGLTYEYSSLSKGTFGIQGEILHLDMGIWGQVGALLDVSGHPGGMAAIGWSLVGVEAQYREYDGRGDGIAIYAKLRIPVSIIARIFSSPPKQSKN